MTRIHIDIETHSEIDLRKVGSSAYAQHPSTDVTCLCWVIDDGPFVWAWVPMRDPSPPGDLLRAVSNDWEIHAWNVKFEADIWLNILGPRYRLLQPAARQWHCTMARAAYWGLPAKLDLAGPALGVPFDLQKFATARHLMLQMARPRAASRGGMPATWWHRTDKDKLDTLVGYCVQDVEAERAIHDRLSPLPERERRIWLADQRMNRRGIAVDAQFAGKMRSLAALAQFDINREIDALTGGQVTATTQTQKLLAFVCNNGMPGLVNLKKDTIEPLANPYGDIAEQALALRVDGAKTSVAKLSAMLEALEPDMRLRGSLRYYGTRTGRWSGAGGAKVQLHNLPRGTLVDPLAACQDIIDDLPADFLRKFHGRTLDVVSSCLRGCFVAGPGKSLVVADLSQIEARMLAWLAGQDDVLDVFRSGQDIYTYDARNLGSTNRQLGKTFRLGAGYGTGVAKMLAIAKQYGVALTVHEAQRHIAIWRSANQKIVGLWRALEQGFRQAIGSPVWTKVVNMFWLCCYRIPDGVAIVLPSGRWLIYRNARIVLDDETGEEALVYDGTYFGQWGEIRTWGAKLAADVTQASARDVLADAILELEDYEVDIVLSIHDEIIAEVPQDAARWTLGLMLHVMRTAPGWTQGGLPVWAEGWHGNRYHKA